MDRAGWTIVESNALLLHMNKANNYVDQELTWDCISETVAGKNNDTTAIVFPTDGRFGQKLRERERWSSLCCTNRPQTNLCQSNRICSPSGSLKTSSCHWRIVCCATINNWFNLDRTNRNRWTWQNAHRVNVTLSMLARFGLQLPLTEQDRGN